MRSKKEIVILSLAKDLLSFAAAILLAFATTVHTQTLARPGWAGSGLASEPWWRTAIFYRINTLQFQDSNADGIGDLRGIAQRLDYLQSLGVDAIVLERLSPTDPAFDDLLREASTHRIRLVITLAAVPGAPDPAAQILAEARAWLTRGAAGIYLRTSTLAPGSTLPRELRSLSATFPGQRVLLAEPAANSAHTLGLRDDAADLTDILAIDSPDAPTLRRTLIEAMSAPQGTPLLLTDRTHPGEDCFLGDPAGPGPIDKVLATIVLASRGAVSLLCGQEIAFGAENPNFPSRMRWTPTNITQPPAPPTPAAPTPKPPAENVYGAFVPYVAPPKPTQPSAIKLGLSAAPNLNALPGFSTTTPATTGNTNAATANVAAEDANPDSLLNFYRRLTQLHHGNPSIRTGTPTILDHDAENALVWVRRAPFGSRTADTVVVACNLSQQTITISLRRDFDRLHLRSGELRPLLASWTQTPGTQPTDRITLPPLGTYIGELYH